MLKQPLAGSPPCDGRSIQGNFPRSGDGDEDESFSDASQTSEAQDFVAGDAVGHAGMHESHACRSIHEQEEEGTLEEDDELGLDGAFSDESVKRKIELLAGMVGVDSTEPLAVLSEVVAALKELAKQASMVVAAPKTRARNG